MELWLLAALYIASLAASIYLVPRLAGTPRWKHVFYGSMALILAAIVLAGLAIVAPLLFPVV